MFKPLIATAFALCLLAPGVQAQDAKAIPDLKGQWEGVGEMHHKVHGHVKHDSKMTTMTVLSQEGRVFHGTLDWANKKAPGKDGVTLYLAGHAEGMRIGKLDGPNALTLYILTPGGANPRAGFADYKRVK
ncbi:MAG: hypothetical protein ACOYNF_15085 [Rhodoferax sp.]